MATKTPAHADADGVWRADTEHPGNQLARLVPSALTEITRWTGPVSLALNAMDAAAIAAHRDGRGGVRELLAYARAKFDAIEHTGFGKIPPVNQAGDT